jgi:hypothetical protein
VVFLRLTLSLALIYYRRFYRRKYDAARTLRAFSSKLPEETDLNRLGGELVSVVRETMQRERLAVVEAARQAGTVRKRGRRCLRWS